MPSTNGHGAKRAILYARVSTDEQARSGYYLAQQLEALRAYCEREGFEVLEEVTDPGQSGASLERPGMDHVRDLVAAGGVAVVLAQDRDRFSREPAHTYLLRREFEEHGTKLKALNDRGGESPEGELTDGILDQLAKYERAKITERSRRGKLQKAREGRLVAGPRPNYGFRYNATRDNYVVNEEEIRVIRRIFRMVGAEGRTMNAVRSTFQREGVKSPTGSKYWSPKYIRDCIRDDVYRSHTYNEVVQLVTPEVAAKLGPEKRYGIWWFNRRRYETKQVVENGPDGRQYRRHIWVVDKPRSEWIAVPVPDSGIPREWVDAAREAIKDNKAPSAASDRFWELSGGIIYCSECSNRMAPHTTHAVKVGGRAYHYYHCPKRRRCGVEGCSHGKHHPAEALEWEVWQAVSGYIKDPERLQADIERALELMRQEVRGDPSLEAKAWADKLAEVGRKRSGYLDLAAEGIMDRDELRTKLAALEETRETAERELAALRDRTERLQEFERDAKTILEVYTELAPDALDTLTPEERQQFYGVLGLRVTAWPDAPTEIDGVFVVDGPIALSEALQDKGFRELELARLSTTS
jgi:site-specific DNA recombinase